MSYYWVQKSERVTRLLDALYERGMSDRSSEWFDRGEFEDISEKYPDKSVAIRKAYAIEEMLRKMTDENCSKHTHTYEIGEDELIVGVIPMGSNGLGKVFPNYLTESERRVASFTNKTELALLGHNTVDYNRLFAEGLNAIIAEARQKAVDLAEADAQKYAADSKRRAELLELPESAEKSLQIPRIPFMRRYRQSARSILRSTQA